MRNFFGGHAATNPLDPRSNRGATRHFLFFDRSDLRPDFIYEPGGQRIRAPSKVVLRTLKIILSPPPPSPSPPFGGHAATNPLDSRTNRGATRPFLVDRISVLRYSSAERTD